MTKLTTHNSAKLAVDSSEVADQLAGALAAYNEITERMQKSHVQLKGEVTRLRGELKQKNELLARKSRLAALGEMAAGMAHEIRNPLAAVQLYASLLERDLSNQPDQLQWVHKIEKGVSSLDTIVHDMLTFTQDQVCQKTDVNIVGLLGEVMDYALPQIKAKAIEFNVDAVDRSLSVHVDFNMMKQVLLNLVLNGLDVVDKKGQITIGAQRCHEKEQYQVRIWVADNGPGIKPGIMNKIFNPFFTTKDVGTGLGLAIVHRLVECHDGIITAANNETGGAIFSIMLPMPS